MFSSNVIDTNVVEMNEYNADQRSELNTQANMDSKAKLREAKNSAVRYLARREYSRLELYQKLITKGFQSDIVNHVLDSLQSDGYQSDERFTEMYIRSRINSGDGPFKIKISLRAKGICDSLALAVFDKLNVDWFDRAQTARRKRFGELPASDITETAKQVRYLKNKGFYQDHINAVVNILEYGH